MKNRIELTLTILAVIVASALVSIIAYAALSSSSRVQTAGVVSTANIGIYIDSGCNLQL